MAYEKDANSTICSIVSKTLGAFYPLFFRISNSEELD